MIDKYDINFTAEARERNMDRLINQIWKLIPMREKEEDWQGHLNIVIEEISGLIKIYKDKPEGLILLSKLEGLTSKVCEDFLLYRKTIFRCIVLIAQVLKDG